MILTLPVAMETADSYVISVMSFFDYFVVRRTRCNFSSKIELLFWQFLSKLDSFVFFEFRTC